MSLLTSQGHIIEAEAFTRLKAAFPTTWPTLCAPLATAPRSDVLVASGFTLDRYSRRLALQRDPGAVWDFAAKTQLFRLLEVLMTHAPEPVHRHVILKQCWDDRYDMCPNTMAVAVHEIRQALWKEAIVTVPKYGYRMGRAN